MENDAPDYYDEGGLEGVSTAPTPWSSPPSTSRRVAVAGRSSSQPAAEPPCPEARWAHGVAFDPRNFGGRPIPVHHQRGRRTSFVLRALTRAKKFLWLVRPGRRAESPESVSVPRRNQPAEPSLPEEPYRWPQALPSVSKVEVPTVRLSFSEWKYFSQCPYMFKLRFLYDSTNRWLKRSATESRCTMPRRNPPCRHGRRGGGRGRPAGHFPANI